MKEIGYDSSKMPLGKLAKESINKGYLILKEIEKELQKKSPSKSNLTKLSSDFFTYIPHDFGFKNMASFIIDTLENVIQEKSRKRNEDSIEIRSVLQGCGA